MIERNEKKDKKQIIEELEQLKSYFFSKLELGGRYTPLGHRTKNATLHARIDVIDKVIDLLNKNPNISVEFFKAEYHTIVDNANTYFKTRPGLGTIFNFNIGSKLNKIKQDIIGSLNKGGDIEMEPIKNNSSHNQG